MHLLRSLHFIAAYYNINLTSLHIEGDIKVTTDAISRNFMQLFFEVNPTADRHPTPISKAPWAGVDGVSTRLDLKEFEGVAVQLINSSIADSTRRSYEQANPPIFSSATDLTCGTYQHQKSSSFCFQQDSHKDWHLPQLCPTYSQ